MLKGFDEHTAPLTDEERYRLVPAVVNILKTAKGKRRAVTNNDIATILRDEGKKPSSARIRKLINHIRNNDLIIGLIATSNGYYIASCEEELIEYEDSLRGREEAIKAVRLSIARQRRKLYEGLREQRTLFNNNND